MNLIVTKPSITPDLAKVNAVTRMQEAVDEAEAGNLKDAYILYGAAITFEGIYDYLVDNRQYASLIESEENCLYKDTPEYRNLFHDWMQLTSGIPQNKTAGSTTTSI